MNNKINQKIIISGILSLLALGSLSYLFILIRNKNAHAGAIANDIATAGTRAADTAKLKRALEDSANARADIDLYFVDQNGVADFLTSLEAFGPQSGAKISISNADINDKSISDQTDKSPKTLKISMSATGTFSQIYRLEKLIENAPYDLDILRSHMVRSDTLDSKGNTQTSWNLSLDLELKSFKAS